MYNNKKIFILGMARSGYEVAKLLSNYTKDIIITDMKEQDIKKVSELEGLGVKFVLSNTPEELLTSDFDYVVKNPGIRKDHLCVLKAHELNIPVINEVEVAYNLLPDVKIIGITGSNGKTTTTTMTYEVLKKAGLPVHLGGNIGYPVSSLVNMVMPGDILVLEISDHQLVDTVNFKTNISALLNLYEAHIDFHGTYDIYKETKKKIFNRHSNSDLAILNFENKDVMELTSDINSSKLYFSSKRKSDCYIEDNYIIYKDEKVISLDDIKLKGVHNYENIMAMIMIVKNFDVSNEIIRDYLSKFNGVEHRIEFVRDYNGVKVYNDSKSTNVDATITALSSFDNPTILLLGGLDRGHSFSPLNEYMKNVKLIVCYGETKERINDWAKSINIPCIVKDTLKESTIEAVNNSKENDVILLSPACASWDQYENFEIRGSEFKNIINSL